MIRPPVCAALAIVFGAVLLTPPRAQAGGGNNLNLLPGKGIRFGIAKVVGTTLKVQTERSTPAASVELNDGLLIITDWPAGSNGPALFNGTEQGMDFASAFPNGGYELTDWGFDDRRELLASRGCLQVKSPSHASWDNARVVCRKEGVTRIKITSGSGTDMVRVDPAITVSVTHKCSGRRSRCGSLQCVTSPEVCCDSAGLPGCVAFTGASCDAFDPNDSETLPLCP